MTKTLGKTIGDRYRIDEITGEENYTCQNFGTRNENRDRSRDRVNYRWDFSNDRNRGRDKDRSRTRDRCFEDFSFC